jgi:hypothetical protein
MLKTPVALSLSVARLRDEATVHQSQTEVSI